MKLLQKLISINSISGKEKEIQKYIGQYIQQLGFTPVLIGDSLLVKIRGKNNKKSIIFNAHIDTVDLGDRNKWVYDPFKGVVVNGKMFGLGASDEKASIAALLLLATKFSKKIPPCDIFLTFVSQEETDGSGTKEILEWYDKYESKKYQSVAGILGEPTGLCEIEIAHKGNVFMKITTYGDSGHGSNPDYIKKHAVLQMFELCEKLQLLQKLWKKKYYNTVLGYPTIGMLTSITAGSIISPNKFPNSCTATFDIRTTPKLHVSVENEIKAYCPDSTIQYVYPPIPSGYTDPTEKIVTVAKDVTKKTIVASSWSNDLCFFTEKNIPAIVFGPGERDVIHKENEYCYIYKITKCVRIYEKIVKEYTN